MLLPTCAPLRGLTCISILYNIICKLYSIISRPYSSVEVSPACLGAQRRGEGTAHRYKSTATHTHLGKWPG